MYSTNILLGSIQREYISAKLQRTGDATWRMNDKATARPVKEISDAVADADNAVIPGSETTDSSDAWSGLHHECQR